MSYTSEQKEKNKAYVEKELENYSHEDRGQVLAEANRTWPDDNGIKSLVDAKKAEIAKRATAEEMDAVFVDFRI